MITHLLDTSVYSQRLRNNPLPTVIERWGSLGDSALSVSSICEAEIRYGLEKKQSKRLWLEYTEYLEHRIQILPVDKQVSDVFGELKAEMRKRGKSRADFDLLIAATARVHNLTLVTLNIKHFADLPGVVAESWAE